MGRREYQYHIWFFDIQRNSITNNIKADRANRKSLAVSADKKERKNHKDIKRPDL